MIPYIIQGNNITVMVDNSPYTVTSSHINFERLKQAIKDQDWDAVKNIVILPKQLLNILKEMLLLKIVKYSGRDMKCKMR